MLEFLYFFVEIIFNFFNFLEEVKIVGNLSILKILIIITLFKIGLKFLNQDKEKKEK